MNQIECNHLRDLLFAAKFASGSKEGIFRYLAVTPGANAAAPATVHYAYAPPSWERAGEKREAGVFLRALIATTPYAEKALKLQFHNYLRDGWDLPWDLTAKASNNDFPVLVLVERANGSVTGALMRDPHHGRTMEKLAEAYVEPDEIEEIIEHLRNQPLNGRYLSWYKDSNIDAGSLDEAANMTAETLQGQKEVLVYRENEWLWGIWNNPNKGGHSKGLHISSVADFHGTRVSTAKRKTRSGLDAVRANQTIPGDCKALEEALGLLRHNDLKAYARDYELVPAVAKLVEWWNAHAPEDTRQAGLFRTYTWVARDKIFAPGDPEEPALQGEILVSEGAYALFEAEGHPPVAIQFHKGRAFNKDTNGGTQIYLANGKEGMDIGLDISEVDEAYYSLKGLQSVREEW